MVVASSSRNMEKLKEGNFEMYTPVNIYVRERCLLLPLNLAK